MGGGVGWGGVGRAPIEKEEPGQGCCLGERPVLSHQAHTQKGPHIPIFLVTPLQFWLIFKFVCFKCSLMGQWNMEPGDSCNLPASTVSLAKSCSNSTSHSSSVKSFLYLPGICPFPVFKTIINPSFQLSSFFFLVWLGNVFFPLLVFIKWWLLGSPKEERSRPKW